GGQFVDLVFLGERADQPHELAGEWAVVAARAVPQALQLVELFIVDSLVEILGDLSWRPRFFRLFSKTVARFGLDLARFISGDNLALVFAQDGHERIQTGAEAANLAGIDANRAAQLFLGQPPRAAVK